MFWPILQIVPVLSQMSLGGYPITFSLTGSTTYTPDAGGSVTNGYKITIGFGKYSWLGISFPKQSTQDVMIFQRGSMYTRSGLQTGHQITVSDYYLSGSGGLLADSVTQYDISPNAFTTRSDWSINMIRTLSNTNNQDWDASKNKYSMAQICFFTGNLGFTNSNYKGDYQQCYFFQITNLVSSFRGYLINTVTFSGQFTNLYGYIYGDIPSIYISVYQPSPLTTYKVIPALAMDVGANSMNSQDYVVYSPTSGQSGDYQGTSLQSMSKDSGNDGYDDYIIEADFQNIGTTTAPDLTSSLLRLAFRRKLQTYDLWDKTLDIQFNYCLHLFPLGGVTTLSTEKVCGTSVLTRLYVHGRWVLVALGLYLLFI